MSPGEQGKRSEEKESQVRDLRLNGEMEGKREPCCYEEKDTDLSGSPTEKIFLQLGLN